MFGSFETEWCFYSKLIDEEQGKLVKNEIIVTLTYEELLVRIELGEIWFRGGG